jgi:hypothetical protein
MGLPNRRSFRLAAAVCSPDRRTNVAFWPVATNRGAAKLWLLMEHSGHQEAPKPEASVAIDPCETLADRICCDAQSRSASETQSGNHGQASRR